jgi:hypothetical protein
MDLGLSFIVGLCFVCFLAAYIYRMWYRNFYIRPQLSRTQISLEIDDNTVYLHHIASITEEYVYSKFLLFWGFILGFMMYLLFFFLNGFNSQSPTANILLSITLTTFGGLAGYVASLDKKLVIRDSGGKNHEINLPEVERVEFKQEVTKDIWRLYK